MLNLIVLYLADVQLHVLIQVLVRKSTATCLEDPPEGASLQVPITSPSTLRRA